MTTRILVTAARGKTGREVVSQLASRQGVEVRAATREPGALPAEARPVRFDWHDSDTWRAALDGVDAVYVVRPEIEDAPERIAEFLHAAEGVEHAVLLSELGADELEDSTWERRVERAVTDNARSWTILRPNWFAQILIDAGYYLEPIRAGTIQLATGGTAVALLDTRDIAAVAVDSLVDRHAGQAYALSGPEALTFHELAERLTAAIGRPVRYVDQSIGDSIAWFLGEHGDPFLVAMVEDVLGRLCAGRYARIADDFERVCGRPPRTIDAFIEEHATLWRDGGGSR